jgi:hypothetical protein
MDDSPYPLPITLPRNKTSYHYMQSTAPIRFLTSASFAFSALLSAQTAPAPQPKPTPTVQTVSTLPATPTTTAPTPPLTPSTPLTPSQEQPKHAQVTLANGILSVTADNSSLNQILRQISHETGIKITGGVLDERVFGQYGPAAPDQILAELLDGTGSNMLLVARNGTGPAELILTPRQGGPTPPSPNAFDDKPESEEAQPAPEPPPPSTFEAPSARNRTIPPITPATPDSATPADASQPDSPNGVKTPQQIYEQLQRLRQPAPPQ